MAIGFASELASKLGGHCVIRRASLLPVWSIPGYLDHAANMGRISPSGGTASRCESCRFLPLLSTRGKFQLLAQRGLSVCSCILSCDAIHRRGCARLQCVLCSCHSCDVAILSDQRIRGEKATVADRRFDWACNGDPAS